MGKLPSGHGQLTTIRLSDGGEGKTITTAAQFAYYRHGLGDIWEMPGRNVHHKYRAALAGDGVISPLSSFRRTPDSSRDHGETPRVMFFGPGLEPILWPAQLSDWGVIET